jgi:hypothetical protein
MRIGRGTEVICGNLPHFHFSMYAVISGTTSDFIFRLVRATPTETALPVHVHESTRQPLEQIFMEFDTGEFDCNLPNKFSFR